jgi:hypothetical protein
MEHRRPTKSTLKDKKIMNIIRNALFISLLCCSGCAAIKGKEVLQPLAARTKEQIIQNLTREGLGTQGVQAAFERHEKSAEAQRLALQARLDESIKENDRRLSQRFEHIQSMGGLQPALEEELQQLRARIHNIPPDKRAETNQRITAVERNLASLAQCRQPTIIGLEPSDWDADPDTRKLLQSGLAVMAHRGIGIDGCKFGDKPGEIRLLLSEADGVQLKPSLGTWEQDYITAVLPPLPPGVLDQNAILEVIREDGKRAEFPVKFLAEREVKLVGAGLPGNDSIRAKCAHSTQHDECVTVYLDPEYKHVARSIGAIHATQHLNFSSVSGTDEWSVNLKNGWALLSAGYFFGQGFSICNNPFNQQGKVSDPVGFPFDLSAYAYHAYFPTTMSSVDFSVDWWVDVNCSEAMYFMDIYIVGPRGVPYF